MLLTNDVANWDRFWCCAFDNVDIFKNWSSNESFNGNCIKSFGIKFGIVFTLLETAAIDAVVVAVVVVKLGDFDDCFDGVDDGDAIIVGLVKNALSFIGYWVRSLNELLCSFQIEYYKS